MSEVIQTETAQPTEKPQVNVDTDFDFEDEGSSGGFASFDDFDDPNFEEIDAPAKEKSQKKEQEKKKLGQKGDDLEIVKSLETNDGEEKKTSLAPKDKDKEETQEDKEEKDEPKDEEKEESEEKKAQDKSPKGKKTYIKVGEETFGIDSNAIVPVVIDGKKQEVTLQELKNEYSGKKYAEQQLNLLSVEKQKIQQVSKQLDESVKKYRQVADSIMSIANDVEKNPKEAFKIFLDAFGLDTYDLEERMMKHDLQELSNLLQMTEVERKAYLLEKKNSHLLSQAEKRKQAEAQDLKVKTYTEKVDALRKSFGVSEAQYVDAYEELKSRGYKDEDLSEKDIVEWAATKPHVSVVQEILSPYEEDFSDDAYGELVWSLATYLAQGKATKEDIVKHVQEVYGVPSAVKELNEKFSPVGRKSATPSSTPPSAKKYAYESFDDLED
jgi:hypothetical protein